MFYQRFLQLNSSFDWFLRCDESVISISFCFLFCSILFLFCFMTEYKPNIYTKDVQATKVSSRMLGEGEKKSLKGDVFTNIVVAYWAKDLNPPSMMMTTVWCLFFFCFTYIFKDFKRFLVICHCIFIWECFGKLFPEV